MASSSASHFDLVVVGAGIVGLAHAYTAARRGLKVCVVERDAACVGASVRNFGFVTVTGQQRGAHWRRARRSRDLWAELAPQAGLRIEHAGLLLAARCEESEALLDAFLATEMGEGCERLDAAAALARQPGLRAEAEVEQDFLLVLNGLLHPRKVTNHII